MKLNGVAHNVAHLRKVSPDSDVIFLSWYFYQMIDNIIIYVLPVLGKTISVAELPIQPVCTAVDQVAQTPVVSVVAVLLGSIGMTES